MNTVTITYSKKYFMGSWRTKKLERQVFSSWDEVPKSWVIDLVDYLLQYDEYGAKLLLIKRILDLPDKVFDQLDTIDVSEIFSLLDWMEIKPSSTLLCDKFEYIGHWYHCTESDFENGAGAEYGKADGLYGEYIEGDQNALLKLTAILYRKLDDNGKRIPYTDNEQIDIWAKEMKDISMSYQLMALMYWAGVKDFVKDTYGPYLFTPNEVDEDGNEIAPEPKNDSSMFGWFGVFMDIAEAGLFGDLDKVHQTNFHSLCAYLVKKVLEAREQERQQSLKTPVT